MRGWSASLATMLLALSFGGNFDVARAQTYPSRSITLVIPFPPGGSTSLVGRVIADKMSQLLGQSIVVDNRGGAGGTVGTKAVMKSDPDGYTLLLGYTGTLAIGPSLYRNVGYDPRKDFTAVGMIGSAPSSLVVHPSFPVTTVAELIAYARANPGRMTFASTGVGSTAHLSAIQLELLGGLTMVHVPYRGNVPALNDVIAGHVDLFFDTVTTSAPMYRAAKVRILAVGSPERSAVVPEVPSASEAGLPGFHSLTWFAMVGPPGFEPALADKINRDVVDGLRRPEVDAMLRRLTLEPMIGSPADAGKFFAEEAARWGRVIKEGNVASE
jgi:tripartite-type tricarboxylate transporter receptor subunit TctC